MLLKFGSRWLRTAEDDAKGGSTATSKEPASKTADDIIAENKALKAQLEGLGPKLSKLEEAEAKREAASKKADEDKRKREVGVEKVLEEKDAALKTTAEKLAAYEKRESARVDALYANLPEAAQQVIEPLRSKLDLVDWGELVEKQATLTASKQEEGGRVSNLIKPGGSATRSAHEPSQKTREILEEIGRGDTMTGKLLVKKEYDRDSGSTAVKFTRHVREFFKDMNVAKPFRIGAK
jgi:hypothetical protein